MVRKNGNKSPEIEQNEQDDIERQLQFRYMRERRRSAPDIHRRVPPIERTPIDHDDDDEMTTDQNLSRFINNSRRTSIAPRKHYNSAG